MLITAAELREHVETDLPDTALERIINAQEAEIIKRWGPHATATELVTGGEYWYVLARPAAAVTAITETIGDTDTLLAADDYRVWPGGRLERLAAGTNPGGPWGDRISITYQPVDETAQRTLALVDLAKLTIAYTGTKSESVGGGDFSMTSLEYTAEREKILRSLAPRGIWFA